jgi:hypothetical protein
MAVRMTASGWNLRNLVRAVTGDRYFLRGSG